MNLILVDSNYMAYQALFAMQSVNLNSPEGVRTEITYNFLSRLPALGKKFNTNNFIFLWDSPTMTLKRKHIYPEYKENRKPITDIELAVYREVKAQFPFIKQTLRDLGFQNIFESIGYESDDLIATLIKQDSQAEITIISNDTDLYQLLDFNVSIFNLKPSSDLYTSLYTRIMFEIEYGIPPSKWKYVKALAGCNTDNVKGIKGVGPKTAIKYITGNLPNTHKIYDKIVKEEKHILAQNLPLVSLPFRGTPVPTVFADDLNIPTFKKVFTDLGFNSFLSPEKWIEWESIFDLKEN
uniref:Putative exonuclease n=1 Tax=viral metagenome TaxID=1070528 RepID=A0A6M3KLG9_9ZZZZ